MFALLSRFCSRGSTKSEFHCTLPGALEHLIHVLSKVAADRGWSTDDSDMMNAFTGML